MYVQKTTDQLAVKLLMRMGVMIGALAAKHHNLGLNVRKYPSGDSHGEMSELEHMQKCVWQNRIEQQFLRVLAPN